MKWDKKAEENVAAIREERRDDARLREAVAIRQHELEKRLRFVIAQAQALKR